MAEARSLPRFQNVAQPPPRAVGTACDCSAREHEARIRRSRQGDIDASIIGFLATHPRSTIGDLARALNLDPEHVATCLTQLTSSGEIYKASHGYNTQQPARLRR